MIDHVVQKFNTPDDLKSRLCSSEIYTSYQNNSIPMDVLAKELRDRFIDKRK